MYHVTYTFNNIYIYTYYVLNQDTGESVPRSWDGPTFGFLESLNAFCSALCFGGGVSRSWRKACQQGLQNDPSQNLPGPYTSHEGAGATSPLTPEAGFSWGESSPSESPSGIGPGIGGSGRSSSCSD